MPRPLRWPQLLPGVLISIGLVAAVAAVFVFARVGGVRGKKVRLYTAVATTGGIMNGSEVWLDGQKVGVVADVRFRSIAADTTARVLVLLDVLEHELTHIRRDSRAQIRPGGTVIGSPVVWVSSGTARAAALAAGDTITSGIPSDMDAIKAGASQATKELPAVLAGTRRLMTILKSDEGSAGAVLHRGVSGLASARAGSSRLMTRFGGSQALGAIRQAALRTRMASISASVDSVRRLLGDSSTAGIGRFRRDSTLLREVSSLRTELDSLRTLAGEPRGTVGRFAADSAISRQLAALGQEMTALFADVKRRPLRYIGF